MDYRVDEKGKYFTTHISKRSQEVILRVGQTLVEGTLHITPDYRLKDELNADETFIPVTDAQVWDVERTRLQYEAEMLMVNKQKIEWVLPRERLPVSEQE